MSLRTLVVGLASVLACASSLVPGDLPVALPTLHIDASLAPPVDRYDGRDIEAGLSHCAPRGGCRLLLASGVVEDVAIEIGSSSPYGCVAPPCYPNGLVIEGAGRDLTVLRQKVPVGPGGEVFRIGRHPPDDLHFRSFTCDGRKQSQPGSAHWQHGECIDISSRYVTPSNHGSVKDLRVTGFLLHGISVRDGSDWEIAGNIVEEIGCDDVETPCHPAWSRSNPRCDGSNYGSQSCPFQDPPRWFPSSPNTSVAGHGIYLPGNDATRPRGHVVRDNTIRGVTKSCITLYGAASETAIEDVVIEGNDISDCGLHGISIFKNARRVTIRDNSVRFAGFPANLGASGVGIGCATVASELTIERNTIAHAQGEGMNLACSLNDSTIRDNTVTAPCLSAAKGHQASFGIDVGAMKARDRGTGTATLRDNQVLAASNCFAALRVRHVDRVVIEGGRYTGGRDAVVRLESARNAVVKEGVRIDGGGEHGLAPSAAGLHAGPGVEAGHIDTSTQIRGAARPHRISGTGRFALCTSRGKPDLGCR